MWERVTDKIQLTQMYNISFVHMFNTLANLSHVIDNFRFGHNVSVRSNTLKQFSSR